MNIRGHGHHSRKTESQKSYQERVDMRKLLENEQQSRLSKLFLQNINYPRGIIHHRHSDESPIKYTEDIQAIEDNVTNNYSTYANIDCENIRSCTLSTMQLVPNPQHHPFKGILLLFLYGILLLSEFMGVLYLLYTVNWSYEDNSTIILLYWSQLLYFFAVKICDKILNSNLSQNDPYSFSAYYLPIRGKQISTIGLHYKIITKLQKLPYKIIIVSILSFIMHYSYAICLEYAWNSIPISVLYYNWICTPILTIYLLHSKILSPSPPSLFYQNAVYLILIITFLYNLFVLQLILSILLFTKLMIPFLTIYQRININHEIILTIILVSILTIYQLIFGQFTQLKIWFLLSFLIPILIFIHRILGCYVLKLKLNLYFYTDLHFKFTIIFICIVLTLFNNWDFNCLFIIIICIFWVFLIYKFNNDKMLILNNQCK